jgi:putative DNA primase/helicase
VTEQDVRVGIDKAAPVEPGDALPPEWSEERLAARFTELHRDDLRYCNEWGRWLRWSGTHWRRDSTLEVFDLIRAVTREVAAQIDARKVAATVASARTVTAVERLARADRVHATEASWFDSNPYLLATPGGTVDLTTGELRTAKRQDLITLSTAVAPEDAPTPVWQAFLDTVTGGDAELALYLQRLAGYGLVADRSEEMFAFLYGTGRNGKSTFLTTLRKVAGDYACTVPADIFIQAKGERHPTELAQLRGRRLVVASEPDARARWDEGRLKMLTGRDTISARFMRADFFEFTPVALLLIAGNHRPTLNTINEAIRRRLHLVPFTRTISSDEEDPDLGVKLRDEWPAILAWAIEGAATWRGERLREPEAVSRATADYLDAEDTVGEFLEEKCLVGPQHAAAITDLFAAWKAWAHSRDTYVGSTKIFAGRLHDRGFQRCRLTGGVRAFRGVTLAPVLEVEDAP